MAIIKKDGNIMALPLSIERGNPIPLDSSAVWYDYALMEAYAQSGATAYVGQILVYVNEAESTSKAYVIADTAGTLTEVGAATLGDDKTITLENGTLSLKNWGKEYYRWVDAVGEEGKEGYVAGHHEKQAVDESHPWIAGLEPKSIAGTDGSYEIAWYQPSTTTVEGLNSAVSSIQTSVNEINQALGDAGTPDTIRGDIASLETAVAGKLNTTGGALTGDLTLSDGSKAASETVVDTKIANAIGSAGHLKRLVVTQLPEVAEADADTIYMVKDATVTAGDAYKEYMLIDGAFVQIGDTSVDLEPYAKTADVTSAVNGVQTNLDNHIADAVKHVTAEERTAWNGKLDANDTTYVSLASNATKLNDLPAIKSIGSGLTLDPETGALTGTQEYTLPAATADTLGGVKVGTGLSVDDAGLLSAKVVTGNGLSVDANGIAMAAASDANPGAISASDYTKLQNIEVGAQKNLIVGALVGGSVVTINEDKHLVIDYATEEKAGVVKSSSSVNQVKVDNATGVMSLNSVGVSKLANEEGTELILNCGNA